MAITVMISGIVGILNAWAATALSRGTPFQRKMAHGFLAMHVLIAIFPLILHSVAWESTAGKFGLTMLTQTGVRGISGAPYGFFGGLLATGWIHGMTGASLVCLATYVGTKRIPSNLIESGRLYLGANQVWWKLCLPIARHWWLTSLLATAMMSATEMTVADLYGFRTLADEFYLLYAANPSLLSVIQTCVLPLVVLIGGSLWWVTSRQRRIALVSVALDANLPITKASTLNANTGFTGVSRATALVVITSLTSLASLVPLMSMLLKLGQHIIIQDGQLLTDWSLLLVLERLFEAPVIFFDEYFWTIVISCFTGTAALMIAWPMASLGRSWTRLRHHVDFATLGIAIVPGPIVAMAVIQFFQLPLPGFSTLYERTIFPTGIALMARAVPIAYWVLRTGYMAVPQQQIDSLKLEMSWIRRMICVDRYLLRRSIVQAWLISMLFASGDVPASLPVLPPGMTTVGSRLFGLLHSGARFQEAALAFWYLLGSAVIAIILMNLNNRHRHLPEPAKN